MTIPESASALDEAATAAVQIADATGVAQHDLAVVLGSGWNEVADSLGDTVADLPASDITGFAPASVMGHSARIRSVRVGDRAVLVFVGRTHLYEQRGVRAVAHHVRVAAACGCRAVVLTNGCGGLRPEWPPGTLVLISDHINLTGVTPLGSAEFVNLVHAYSPQRRAAVMSALPDIPEGVYAQVSGPQFETPAEIRMLATMGADLVGMSTAIETIAARAAGLEVVGVALVTNFAAGLTGEAITADEVLHTGRESAAKTQSVLDVILRTI